MASLIQNTIEIVQGDSSDIYEFSSDDFPNLSSADWTSKFSIRDKTVKGTELATGDLTKNEDNTAFIFQLTPTVSASLTPGLRHLSIEVKNLTLNFRQEIVQVILNVKDSGVSNA